MPRDSSSNTIMDSTLVCFVHPKSGGSGAQGVVVLNRLRELLGHDKVHDITEVDINQVLKVAIKAHPKLRILVGGGDGSQSWILSELDKLDQSSRPPVGPLAMGTGNDLSRILGWGGGYTGSPLEPIIKQITSGRLDKLDRWKIQELEGQNSVKLDVINNYCSIGLDAKIGYQFDQKRRANPNRFTSRSKNKRIYTYTTAANLLTKDQKLHRVLKLTCDGKDYSAELARYKPKTLLLLNISSYAGGHDLWGRPGSSEGLTVQSPKDGKLDVCIGDRRDMLSSLCLGTNVKRLCQAREITIEILEEEVPFQIDGEPWLQAPSKVQINLKNSVPVVVGPQNSHSTCVLCCKTSTIKYK